MAKMGFKAGILLLTLSLLGSVSCPAMSAGGWSDVVSSLRQRGDQSMQWCDEHKELLQLAGCAAQIPGILTTDSKSALAIRAAALLSMTATDAKVLAELFKHSEGCLAKHCVYDVPKTMLYVLASYYDYVRLTGTPKVLPDGSPAIRQMRLCKITQFFQLGLEVVLRILAYMDKVDHATPAPRHISGYLSELADWVELWRLVSRFAVLSDQDATFDERLENAKKSLAALLSSLSGDLAKRSIGLPVVPDDGKHGAQ